MPKLDREIDDEGNISYEQTGNMPGTPETERGVSGNYSPHGYAGQVELNRQPITDTQLGMGTFSDALQDSSAPWRAVLGAGRSPYTPVTNLQDQARLEQQRVIQALQAQAAGDPNSLAQQQLRNAYAGAQSQQSSLGSTMRGQSAGAAMRGIQAGQQGIQRSLPGDQQMLMLQEQQAAQAMLAQLLEQQRGQDTSWQQGLSGITNARQALDDFYKQFNTANLYGLDVGGRDAQLQQIAQRLGLDAQNRGAADQSFMNFLNAVGTATGGFFSMGGSGNPASGGGSGAPSVPSLHPDSGKSHY
jgi:hypothetical protein